MHPATVPSSGAADSSSKRNSATLRTARPGKAERQRTRRQRVAVRQALSPYCDSLIIRIAPLDNAWHEISCWRRGFAETISVLVAIAFVEIVDGASVLEQVGDELRENIGFLPDGGQYRTALLTMMCASARRWRDRGPMSCCFGSSYRFTVGSSVRSRDSVLLSLRPS